MSVLYIIIAILLFGVMIFVHEFGHFSAAKLCGVRVNEFSIFMGPAIFKKKKGETLYSLRCIPIGGYCAMEGEDADSDDPRAFGKAKVWKKLVILLAGSTVNIVVGFLLILLAASLFYGKYPMMPGTAIGEIEEGRPFAEVLQPGDEFYSINGRRVYVNQDITFLLDRDTDGFQDITVRRNGEKVRLENVPIARDYVGEDGVKRYGFSILSEETTPGRIFSYAWNNSLDVGRQVWMFLGDLFSGNAGLSDAAGAVGIVATVVEVGNASETVGLGLLNVLNIFGFIAINLGIMNLLPIPALDGGRIVCLLVTTAVEKIFKKKINPKYEAWLNGIFMVLLLGLMVLLVFKDVFSLFK